MTTPYQTKQFSNKEESMFDLNTYLGRIKHFMKVTDMRMIFLKKNDIEECRKLLSDFENNPQKYNLSDEKVNSRLWKAKYAIKSAVNGETGNILPIPTRMCAFVPVNIPICFGLICMPPTFRNIIFFNFLNQTYNAVMNYSNGSGTEDSVKYTLISYFLAVVSSISTGLLLKKKFDKKQSLSSIQEAVVRLVPTMTAGFLNLFFMRSDYFTKGVNIKDENGKVLGLSKICGIKAVMEGALSRVFLPLPLLLNHFFLKRVSKMHLPKKASVFIELTSCSLALSIGLPCSIAVFKENSKFKTDLLELELRNKLQASGIKYVYYNKGL